MAANILLIRLEARQTDFDYCLYEPGSCIQDDIYSVLDMGGNFSGPSADACFPDYSDTPDHKPANGKAEPRHEAGGTGKYDYKLEMDESKEFNYVFARYNQMTEKVKNLIQEVLENSCR